MEGTREGAVLCHDPWITEGVRQMGQVVLRLGAVEDAEVISAIGRRFYADLGHPNPGFFTAELLVSMMQRPSARPEDFWTAEVDGVVVGGASLFAMEPYSEISAGLLLEPNLPEASKDELRAQVVERAISAARPYVDRAPPDVAPHLVFMVVLGDPLADYLGSLGAKRLRAAFEMARSLEAWEPTAPLPEGVTLRPLTADDDAEVAEVCRAFEDHHGDHVMPPEDLAHFLSVPDARRDLCRLAEDDQGSCGVVLCQLDPAGGYVAVLATVRRARGRGVGAALLDSAFGALRDEGCTLVRLNVDAENITGALRIYERAGMHVAFQEDQWALPLR